MVAYTTATMFTNAVTSGKGKKKGKKGRGMNYSSKDGSGNRAHKPDAPLACL